MMPDVAPNPVPKPTVPTTAPAPMQKPPELTKTPEKCAACDMMVTLGLLTSSCEGIKDPAVRTECKTLLKPLEDGKDTAVESLANVIVALGEEHLDIVVERMNLLLYDATARAKEKLIADGVLNKDGTPKT